MPTFERTPQFKREFMALPSDRQAVFIQAVRDWVKDLKAHGIQPNDPRVAGLSSAPGVFEFRWAANGRATFEWGVQQVAGEPHVRWRRIGTHAILKQP